MRTRRAEAVFLGFGVLFFYCGRRADRAMRLELSGTPILPPTRFTFSSQPRETGSNTPNAPYCRYASTC
jgi:hypothetical protein